MIPLLLEWARFQLNDFRGTTSHNDIVKLYQNVIASKNFMPSVRRGLGSSTSPSLWWLHLCPLLTQTGLNRRIEVTLSTGSAVRKNKTNYESLNCWKTILSWQQGNFWKTAIWNSWISTFSLHEEVASISNAINSTFAEILLNLYRNYRKEITIPRNAGKEKGFILCY